MTTNKRQDQMSAVEDVETGADIDELVIGPTRQRRQLPTRWTMTALLSGAAVIGAVGLAGALALDSGNPPGPAGPAPLSSTLPGAPASGIPTSSGSMTQKQLEILELIKAKLPGELEVTAHHGIGTRSIVAIAIADSQGYTWADTRVGTTGEDGWDPCRAVRSCFIERVKGGTFYTLQELESSGNGTHYAVSYTYERPDGRFVTFSASNIFNPDGRRSSPPLTDVQVRLMLTAPEWDGLVADCRPNPGPNC